MTYFPFYLRQAWANLNRHRQRTLFVLFCIGIGVAVVVSLRTLGFMIEQTLTGNLQAENRGDMVIAPINDIFALGQEAQADPALIEAGDQFGTPGAFSDRGLKEIVAWAEENGFAAQVAIRQQGLGRMRPLNGDGTLGADFTTIYAVEGATYPYYSTVEVLEPAGGSLADALAPENGVVVIERLANELDLAVGDEVLITGNQPFVVTAIVDDGAEATLVDLNTVLVPYAYVGYETGARLFATRADTIYIQLPADGDVVSAAAEFEAAFPGFDVRTTEEVREFNSGASEAITRLITTMGLVSLLIGGIGIVNTMVVIVGRRTQEIGVLKTIGLQAGQITTMFIVEAFLLGVIGSVLGVVLGIGLVFVLQRVAERLFAQGLQFALYPQALLLGLVLGVVVTLVFGFLPTISAGRVRPNVVLSPNETIVPRAGKLLSLVIVAIMTAIVGLLGGVILGNLLLGVVAAFGTLVTLGVATLIFWFIIVIFSRLPSFGLIRLKLAQRALGAQAVRAASTMLALVVGVASLSVILLMTNSLLSLIETATTSQLGGNILAQAESSTAAAALEAVLDETPGVLDVQRSLVYSAQIVAVDGNRDMDAVRDTAVQAGRAELGMADLPDGQTTIDLGPLGSFDIVLLILNLFLEASTVQTADNVSADYTIVAGRDLAPDGEGEMVVQESQALDWLGLDVGSTLTFRYADGAEATVTIVGLIGLEQSGGVQVQTSGNNGAGIIVVSDGAIPAGLASQPPTYVIDADPALIDGVIRAVNDTPGIFAFDARQINQLLERLAEQLIALPLVIAALALIASAIIIANSVSLATLERRREIGIMKAVGVQTSSVLSLLLLENGLVGLLGGIIGTSVGAVGVFLAELVTDDLSNFPIWTVIGLVVLAVAVTLGATLITAVGAAREKPLIVLRYE